MCRIIKRYAKALLQLGCEENVLDRLHEDINGLIALCEDNASLVTLLHHSTIPGEKKRAIFRSLLVERVHPFTWNMLTQVFQRGYAPLLLKISKDFLLQYNQYHNVKQGVLITAWPVREDEVLSLQNMAKRIISCRSITLQSVVDPSLLGGYILRVEDKQLDRSFRGRLSRLRNRCTRMERKV